MSTRDKESVERIDLLASTSNTKEELIRVAKLAGRVERYADMAVAMKSATEKAADLSIEERTMLCVAYKNVVAERRSAWRTISNNELKKMGKNENKLAMATWYRLQLETELKKICTEVLTLLDNYLLRNTTSSESVVFYRKMQADYLRYISEVTTGEERRAAMEASEIAYRTAADCAEAGLHAAHPVRLGVALNWAVSQYEIGMDTSLACQTAKKAFDAALETLETMPPEEYKDAALIMQLLRDNLMLWSADQGDEDAAE